MSQPRFVQLGQFVDENAEAIAERLDSAGIPFHAKRSGGLVRLLSAADWGTRLFVPEDDRERAAAIADEVLGD